MQGVLLLICVLNILFLAPSDFKRHLMS